MSGETLTGGDVTLLTILCFLLKLLTFRSTDVAVRKKYVQLVESVKENGGDVK